eukprot:5616894-Pyramimonas_sp.AAC.1
MQVEKVAGGYAVSGKTSLIDDILKELGLEDAKPAVLPETKNEVNAENDQVWRVAAPTFNAELDFKLGHVGADGEGPEE